MNINKSLKRKHFRKAMSKRFKAIVYKMLTPLIKLETHVHKQKELKREAIRELGRNMDMNSATGIALRLIVEYLIEREDNVEFVVAEYGDSDYGTYTTLRWLLNRIPCNNKNKEYEMLRYYLYKNDTFGDEKLDFNREFTQAIYDEIVVFKGIEAKWVVDRERYGNFRSRKYEKTLVIELE